MKKLMIVILTLMISNIVLAQEHGSGSKSHQTSKGSTNSDYDIQQPMP